MKKALADCNRVVKLLNSRNRLPGLMFINKDTGDICLGKTYLKDNEKWFHLYGRYYGEEEEYLIRLEDVKTRNKAHKKDVPIYINKGNQNNYLFNELGIVIPDKRNDGPHHK